MLKNYFRQLLALVICVSALTTACRPEKNPPPVLSAGGSDLVIDAGSHRLAATIGNIEKFQFLLKDESKAVKIFSGGALVTTMPLPIARELQARQSNFFSGDVQNFQILVSDFNHLK